MKKYFFFVLTFVAALFIGTGSTFAVDSYPAMTYCYTNNLGQSNRYLKEVTSTQGANVTVVFSAAAEADLPREDYDGTFSDSGSSTKGALVDKTAVPMLVEYGSSSFTVNFKAWTNNMTLNGTAKGTELDWTQQAVYVDWNNNGVFTDAGENLGKNSNVVPNSAFTSAAGYTRTINVPADQAPGTYRMRVCYYEPSGAYTEAWDQTLFTTKGAKTRNGKSYDFAISIKNPPSVKYIMTGNVAPAGAGTVTINGQPSPAEAYEGFSASFLAAATEDYKFSNWTDTEGNIVGTSNPHVITNVSKDMTFTANFIPAPPYEKLCKPTILSVNNPSFINNAELVNPTGVVGVIDFSSIVKDKSQKGVTPEIEAEAGATLGIKYTFTCNWNSQIIYQIEKNNTASPAVTYGPYDNSWPGDGTHGTKTALYNMQQDGMEVDLEAQTAIFPFTFSEDLDEGDIVVIRHICGASISGACASVTDGNYVDILFRIIKSKYKVTVASADEEMGDVYIDTKGNKRKDVEMTGTETVTLTAEPTEGYHFVSWNLDGVEVSTDAVYTTTAITENRNYIADFAFTPVTPRQITVVSADNSKGSVAIISPETEETSINTGEIVIVEASPANSDNFFVNWTDGSGNVLGTSTTYKYIAAPAITMTANFITKYVITDDQSAGGVMTVKDGDRIVVTGDRVAEGSVLTITIKADKGKGLDQLFINGVDVYVEGQDVYTTTVTKATTIMPVYGDPKCRLYYSYEGAGYIEVWSADTYDPENEVLPVGPDGEQYSHGVLLPYDGGNGNVYIFVYPYDDGVLQSIMVNGDEFVEDENFLTYGDIEKAIDGPINIKAVFTGVSTGVEGNVSSSGIKVYGVSGGIVINSESPVAAEIFTAGGELISTPSVSGNSTVSMASGFYIVRVNGAAYKVSVK